MRRLCSTKIKKQIHVNSKNEEKLKEVNEKTFKILDSWDNLEFSGITVYPPHLPFLIEGSKDETHWFSSLR